MRVFVAGGTGFVGRYVVGELEKVGYEVVLGVRTPRDTHLPTAVIDLGDRASIKRVLEEYRVEVVVYLVGILYELKSQGQTFEKLHYFYPINLYECARELGISRVLHMSALGTDDEAPSRYHQTKRWAERYLMESGLTYTIFRPSLILGPEQRLLRDMDKLTKYVPVVALPGGGGYKFQPVDVRDVAGCFAKALQDELTGIYELCGDREVSFKELLRDIFSFLGRKVLMVPLPKGLMYYLGKLVETVVEPPPFSSDQILMMWRDNVCFSGGVKRILGREPIPYEESLRWALEGYKTMTSESDS